MTSGLETGSKPLLAIVVLIGLALVGREFAPVLLTGLVTATLVVLVAFKLWSAQRYLRTGT